MKRPASARRSGGRGGAARNASGGGSGMWFVWTPQRVRIIVYFAACYFALC